MIGAAVCGKLDAKLVTGKTMGLLCHAPQGYAKRNPA